MTPSPRRATLAFSVAAFVLSNVPAALAAGHGECSYRKVSGPYGYNVTGTRVGIGPVASTGVITFEEDGTVTGEQTASFNGTIAKETYSGTYTVEDDCTASFTVVVTSSIPALNRTTTVDLVFDDDANAAHAIFTSPQTILTADARRVFRRDD